jgi:hypothetical protein
LRRKKRLDESAALLRSVIADAQTANDREAATAANAELALVARRGCMPSWRLLLLIGGPILLVILLVIFSQY